MSLSDFSLSRTVSFNIIANSNLNAPVFISAITNPTACIGCTNPSFPLPLYSDEDGDVVTLTVVTTLPSFITFSAAIETFTFNPTLISEVGTHTITV